MNHPSGDSIAKWHLGLAVAGILFLLSPLLVAPVRPSEYEGGRSRSEAAERARNSGAVARLLGEMRTSMSDILFIKTERYLHMGVAYQSHGSGNVEMDPEDAHVGVDTLVLDPDSDFRGFIGHLERRIKPWRDPSLPHLHSDGRELLPWYRLMTLSDPHYIRGYLIGSWWLNRESPAEALNFIAEGVRNNPDAFQLHLMKGQILRGMADRQEDVEEGDALRRRALNAFVEGYELVLNQRPPGEDMPDLAWWTEYVENDAHAVVQMAVLLEARAGDPAVALERARRALEVLPGDGVLERQVRLLSAELEETAPPPPVE